MMSFPFLLLPLEVRRPIYRYALPRSVDGSFDEARGISRTSQSSEFVHGDHDRERRMAPCPVRWHKGVCPNMLFTNRQIHEEACEVLYHENTFPIYVRHPRYPRLPLNESRADEDSFAHISWSHRNWSHPRNPKIPLAVLRTHRHLSHMRRLHVNLPEMRDLLAADMYMRATSYASHHGLSAWIEKLVAAGGKLPDEEGERMTYVKQIKAPIDEVAELLQCLPRIDRLAVIFPSERHEPGFIEHLTSGILHLRGVKYAQCHYTWSTNCGNTGPENWHSILHAVNLREAMMAPRMRDLERHLKSLSAPKGYPQVMGLSAEAIEMLVLLEAMRDRTLLIQDLRSNFEDRQVDKALVLPMLTHVIRQ